MTTICFLPKTGQKPRTSTLNTFIQHCTTVPSWLNKTNKDKVQEGKDKLFLLEDNTTGDISRETPKIFILKTMYVNSAR